MIRVSDLEFRYPAGAFRLMLPRFQVEPGSTVAVIGPSGTGKTTLLNLVAGIVQPQTGRVVTAGVELSGLGDAARRRFRVTRVGMVFQAFELLDYLNVLDNILLPYRISPALRLDRAVRARAIALAERVGVADKLERFVERLSQGERQRVAVCRALLAEPDLVLADEPTGNLDPANKGRVLDILFDDVARRGTTLLVVTHDHDLLPRFERVVDFQALFETSADAPGASLVADASRQAFEPSD